MKKQATYEFIFFCSYMLVPSTTHAADNTYVDYSSFHEIKTPENVDNQMFGSLSSCWQFLLDLPTRKTNDTFWFDLNEIQSTYLKEDGVLLKPYQFYKSIHDFLFSSNGNDSEHFEAIQIDENFVKNEDSLNTDGFNSSIILLGNNLTLLDSQYVKDRVSEHIKFEKFIHGIQSKLLFELTEKQLQDCESSKSSKLSSSLTLHQSFTVKNAGALTIYVKGFYINGKMCQGYGFSIIDCQAFQLKPNETKKIDVVYYPDFTALYIQKPLTILTDQGLSSLLLQFNILSSVPKYLLLLCSETLFRPHWENYIYYCFLFLTSLLILSVLISAYIDSRQILHTTFFPFLTIGIHSKKIENSNLFDLKVICASAVETNSYIKQSYQPLDPIKEKQLKSSSSCHTNLNSVEDSASLSCKQRDSYKVRHLNDDALGNFKHFKRKNSRCSQFDESLLLNRSSNEMHKIQSQKCWTHFLKPTTSNFSSSCNKSSSTTIFDNVGNHTMNSFNGSLKLEIPSKCIKSENQSSQCKLKNENKLVEKKYNKKSNAVHEETFASAEVSSSDLYPSKASPKLQDVCTSSKASKNVCWKSCSKENSSLNISESKPVEVKEVQCYQLSSKIEDQKQVKDSCEKNTNDDTSKPSHLELPYKPKNECEHSHSEVQKSISSPNVHQSSFNSTDKASTEDFSYSHLFKCDNQSSSIQTKVTEEKIQNTLLNHYQINQTSSSNSEQPYSSKINSSLTKVLESEQDQPVFFAPSIWNDSISLEAPKKYKNLSPDNCVLLSNVKISDGFQNYKENSFYQDETSFDNEQIGCYLSPGFQAQNLEENDIRDPTLKSSEFWADWPGINMSYNSQSFWDSNCFSSHRSLAVDDSYNQNQFNEMSKDSSDNKWSNPGATVWNIDDSEWPSSDVYDFPRNHNENICLDSSSGSSSQNIFDIGEFDPFQSPSALWLSQIKAPPSEEFKYSNSAVKTYSLFSDATKTFSINFNEHNRELNK